MIPALRENYNKAFTVSNYHSFIRALSEVYPGQLDFRIAETPVFVPFSFTEKMLSACEAIIDVITSEQYQAISLKAIPPNQRVPGEEGLPQFICFDFGVCLDNEGQLEPQLIELQGFPSLFAWQVTLPEVHSKFFPWPDNFSFFLNDLNRQSYTDLLRQIILDKYDPENVILLEVLPHQQKTRVDFYSTEEMLGIKTVCLTELIAEGSQLFYINNGIKTPIKRIYNRVIFDDLFQQSEEIREKGKIFFMDLDVSWAPHPNWFYRLSKFTLPFIRNPFVPKTYFLNEVAQLPPDLENYVVKPLYSFAGQGVIIDVTLEEIAAIKDPENWILQKKVQYAAAIQTPSEPAKAEIRLFYFWPPGAHRPIAVNNLARLSKGKMIGVRYNKNMDWVGGSFCLFEKG